MTGPLKLLLIAGAGLLAVASRADAALFTVTTGGTIEAGTDRGLFGAAAERDLAGLSYVMSMTVDTDAGTAAGDAIGFAASGAGATAILVSVTVDGVTFSGFSGSDAFDATIDGSLSVTGSGIDGLFVTAIGEGQDGQVTRAFQGVLSFVNAFVAGGGDPLQALSYVVDPAVDVFLGEFVSDGPQGGAELSLLPEWITLNQDVAVPEPAGLAMLGLGLVGLAALRRRR